MWRLTKVHKKSVPINAPRSSCWTTSHRGCSLRMCFWAILYPPFGLRDEPATREHRDGGRTSERTILSTTRSEGQTSEGKSREGVK
jgi:hypothetical protein